MSSKSERYVVTKGDLGYRIYDRQTRQYARTSYGYVRWFPTKDSAERYRQRIITLRR